ncbi:MAG: L-lactate dehydrogenase [Candidatus Lokiarchaeota archaeon]|nr:L-lactate dehydrogenase [Candidatus Lokiarchaeota archaeon]
MVKKEKSNFYSGDKVAIVGTGNVGSSAAYAMMLDGIVSEIALIDKDKEKAQGHALDLYHGMQFTNSIVISAGDSFELVKNSKIVILSAGLAQKPGETRLELLQKNVSIFKNIIPQIIRYNKDCILLVVTNPLDILTYVTYKLSGFDRCKVFGTGTVLDTSRLRYLIGEKFKISPKDVTAYILGEHGDSQFVWWSHANIAGIPIFDSCYMFKSSIKPEDFFENIHDKVKNAAYDVIEKKGATYYAIALVVAKIVRAILLDQSRIFSVSSYLYNYRNISDVCLSIPVVMRRSGICEQLDVILNDEEDRYFNTCVRKVRESIQEAEKIIK